MTEQLPVIAAKLPPATACDVKSMSPQECAAHRARICLEVEIVLQCYWAPDRSESMSAAVKALWMDELEGWLPEQVQWAMRKWMREHPDRRPNPGHILAILSESWGKKHADQVRAAIAPPAEPPKQRISDEARARILAERGGLPAQVLKTVSGIQPTE